jgi:predicted glutamine amidotransferase
MCELLGISVSPAATMGVYFKELRPHADRNPSGWGVGWYEDRAARVVKEPVRADESEQCSLLLAHPPRSGMFVIHVRAATVGRLTMENTHPFQARALGRDWLFAHNGTIRNLQRLSVGSYRQLGETDSEVAFHYLLTRLEALGPQASEEAIAAEVLEGARELSADGTCNFLLSDGRTLFASYDGHKTMSFLSRRAEDLGTVTGQDEDYRFSLSVGDGGEERAVIVASKPLTEEPWHELQPGEFLVCRDGLLVDRVSPGAAVGAR